MSKSVIAIFFSIMFTSLTIAPNILVLVDDNFEFAMFLDSTEDEEKKGEEKVKDFEIETPSKDIIDHSLEYYGLAAMLNVYKDNYNSLFKELTSPPPELSIL